MKNLENYGVQEMNAQEIRETDGGFFGIDDAFLVGFIAGAIIGGLIYDGLKWVYTTDVEEYGAWLLANGSPGGAK